MSPESLSQIQFIIGGCAAGLLVTIVILSIFVVKIHAPLIGNRKTGNDYDNENRLTN